MKKLGILFIVMAGCMLIVGISNVNATLYGMTAAGATLTIDPTPAGFDNMAFNPSPRVAMSAAVSANGFAVNGVHEAAIGTEGGKAYGMAGDSNKVFFLSVADDDVLGDIDAVSTSDSSALSTYTKQN